MLQITKFYFFVEFHSKHFHLSPALSEPQAICVQPGHWSKFQGTQLTLQSTIERLHVAESLPNTRQRRRKKNA